MAADLACALAADLAYALDPVELARRVGLPPDPWQADFLRSVEPRILLNCSRQSGKSTVTALLAVHAASYDPGALVLLLSPSLRQSQELFRKALDVYRALEHPVPTEAESALRLELTNGSRIVSLPVQALFQTERILLQRTPETDVLREELETYEIRVDENANDRYGAFRVGTHDDLVTALGLAVQVDQPGGGAFAWVIRRPDRGGGRSVGSLRSDWIARLRG